MRKRNPGTVRVSTANSKAAVISSRCAIFRPATAEFRFIFKFIVAKEQSNIAMKHLVGKEFYVFVNVYCAEHGYGQSVGVYKDLWGLLEPHAKLIKEDAAYKLYIVQFPDSMGDSVPDLLRTSAFCKESNMHVSISARGQTAFCKDGLRHPCYCLITRVYL